MNNRVDLEAMIREELTVLIDAHFDHIVWCGFKLPLHRCIRYRHVPDARAAYHHGRPLSWRLTPRLSGIFDDQDY